MTFSNVLNRRDAVNRSSLRFQELDNAALARIAPSVLAEGAHESRSFRYTYVPTIAIVESLRAEGWGVYRASQSTTRVSGMLGHTKHMITLRRYADIERVQQVGDHINQISIINSHNGTSKAIGMQGVFELVCLNGMVVSKGESTEFRVAHKGDVVAGILEAVLAMAANFDRVDAMRELMQTTVLTREHQEIFARQAIRARFDVADHADAHVSTEQVLRARRYADQGNDAWRTLNRVQENMIQGGLRTRRADANNRIRRGSTREITGIDQNVAVNRHLWASMETMIAEIRGLSAPAAVETPRFHDLSHAEQNAWSADRARAHLVQSTEADVISEAIWADMPIPELASPAAAPEAPAVVEPTPVPFHAFGSPAFVLITGRTYPVRHQLRQLGGQWDGAQRGWLVPASVASAARLLVGGA